MECPICGASIVKVRFYKADVELIISEDEKVTISRIEPRTQYHVRLICAEGHSGEDDWATKTCDEEMKIWYNELPDEITTQLQGTPLRT